MTLFEKKGVPFFVARKRDRANVGGLYVASGSRIHHRAVVDRCVVPVRTEDGGTRPCGHPLFEDEPPAKLAQHVARCCQENHDTIMEVRARQHPAIMDAWDPELEAYVNRHAQAILEGRKRI